MPDISEAIKTLTQTVTDARTFMEEHVKNSYEPLAEEVKRLGEKILEDQREVRRAQIFQRVEDRGNSPSVRSGRYAGMDSFDLQLSLACLDIAASKRDAKRSVLDGWRESITEARKDLAELEGRALDADAEGAGAELTFEGLSTTMWRDLHLATMVSGLFARIAMPTNPFRIPFEFGDTVWYRGSANTAGKATNVRTNRATIEAETIKTLLNWSYELDEETVIAVLPELRATLVRNGAEVWDDLVLHGDRSDDGTNINADGADAGALDGAAGLDHFLSFDGLIHRALVDNPSQTVNHNSGANADMFNNLRARLGRFGVRPGGMAFITDIWTYIRAQTADTFRTLDKLGPRATVLTGQLGDVEGVPVIVSEQMKLADVDGKVTNSGNGTDTGRLVGVARSQYLTGAVREMLIETERDIQQQQTVMVASFRMGFTGRAVASEDKAVAVTRNITGVA